MRVLRSVHWHLFGLGCGFGGGGGGVGPTARSSALLVTERTTAPSTAALVALGLSSRESQVLALVALGKTNTEIARFLSVSPGTVKRHLEHVYEKLEVHTRTAAAAVAWAASEPPSWRVTRAGPAVRIV